MDRLGEKVDGESRVKVIINIKLNEIHLHLMKRRMEISHIAENLFTNILI